MEKKIIITITEDENVFVQTFGMSNPEILGNLSIAKKMFQKSIIKKFETQFTDNRNNVNKPTE